MLQGGGGEYALDLCECNGGLWWWWPADGAPPPGGGSTSSMLHPRALASTPSPPFTPRPTPTTYIPPLSPHTGHYCLLRGYPQLMQANSIQLTRCLCLCFFSKGGKVLLKYICVLVIKELNCRSSGVSSKGPPSHLQPQC